MQRRLLVMLAAPGLVLALAACDSSTTTSNSTPSSAPAAAASSCPADAPAGTGTNIAITATNFCFSPATLNLAAGKAVSITFVNGGTNQHNLTLGGQDLGSAQPGESKTFTYTPASGDTQFFCKFHKDTHNMHGTLAVTGTGGAAPRPRPPVAPPTKSYNPYGY